MTTEIELLPMPNGEAVGMYRAWSYDQMQAYARANIARTVAPLQAEIERLRAEVDMLKAENARLRDEAASALRADAEKVVAWARPVYARPVSAPDTGEWDELVDIEFHTRPEKPEGEGWRPLVVADTGDYDSIKVAQSIVFSAKRMEKALKDIRSLSSINSAMNPSPLALTALLGDIHHIADAALAKEKGND